jgi:hypothetical protein
MHAEKFVVRSKSKKIAVKVSLQGTGLRSSTWRSRTLETPTLTALKNIKNKIPNVFAKKDQFKKDDVKMLNTEYMPTINT